VPAGVCLRRPNVANRGELGWEGHLDFGRYTVSRVPSLRLTAQGHGWSRQPGRPVREAGAREIRTDAACVCSVRLGGARGISPAESSKAQAGKQHNWRNSGFQDEGSLVLWATPLWVAGGGLPEGCDRARRPRLLRGASWQQRPQP